MSVPGLSSLTGGGGLSASSSASTGPQRSGDVSGAFTFGGIQTGGSQGGNVWLIAGLIGLAAVALLVFLRR